MIQTHLKSFGVPLSSATYMPSNNYVNGNVNNIIIAVLINAVIGLLIYSIHQQIDRVVEAEKGEIG